MLLPTRNRYTRFAFHPGITSFQTACLFLSSQGVEEDAKPEVWPYLLGVYTPDMTTREKDLKLSCVRIEFDALMEACKVRVRVHSYEICACMLMLSVCMLVPHVHLIICQIINI